MLLTIRIIKDRQAYAEASRKLGEDIERVRVGARQGLMISGRERIAQTHYHQAIDALNESDEEQALWHLNLALYTKSTLLPAIQLREKLLGGREWDVVSMGGREFLYSLMMREKGYDLPPFGRPKIELPSGQIDAADNNGS